VQEDSKHVKENFQIVKRPLHGRRGIHLNNTPSPQPFSSYGYFAKHPQYNGLDGSKFYPVAIFLCQIIVRAHSSRVANHPLYNYKDQTVHGSKIRVFRQLQQHKKWFLKENGVQIIRPRGVECPQFILQPALASHALQLKP
jgi:hypothetical protein